MSPRAGAMAQHKRLQALAADNGGADTDTDTPEKVLAHKSRRGQTHVHVCMRFEPRCFAQHLIAGIVCVLTDSAPA